MKRKSVAGILTMALIGTMLSGCGANEDAAGEAVNGAQEASVSGTELAEGAGEQTDDGVVTLTVWAEEANFELLNQMIESFKEEYAGQAEFDIQLVEKADADTKNNLLGDIHNGADVFPLPDDQLTSMVAAGALMPVPNADEVREANLEEAVEAATVADTLYAYPMTADNGFFLYYDKDYFTEEDVATMDGILAVAAAADKKVTMDWSSGWYLYAFFGNTGMDFGVNEDGVTNYCNWNTTEGSIKGVDVAEAMLAIAGNPGFMAATDDVFLSGVQDGSVIAGVSGVWNAAEIKEAWGDDYGAVKLPTYTCAGQQVQMSSFTGYKMLGVNAYSQYPEWAAKLADWMTNEENQTLRLMERDQGPSNKNAAASDAVKNVPAIQAVIAQAQYGRLQRVGNSYWTPTQEFGNTMAAGNPTGADLQELMDTLVNGITASTVQ
ncbi:MAG: extracellular solute-binding protein [Roseburia sp.]|nr:extracellular solute-binding protein [Roseburia sp.]